MIKQNQNKSQLAKATNNNNNKQDNKLMIGLASSAIRLLVNTLQLIAFTYDVYRASWVIYGTYWLLSQSTLRNLLTEGLRYSASLIDDGTHGQN